MRRLSVLFLAACSTSSAPLPAPAPAPAPAVASAAPSAQLDAAAPELPVTADDVLGWMRRLPRPCAFKHACPRGDLGLFRPGPDAQLVVDGIVAAVNSETCAHVLCTKRDDAAMLTVFAVYDSGARKCGTWKGDASCEPSAAAASWLARAGKARDDCMSDYGNIEADPPIYRTYTAPRGWQEPYATDLASSWAVLIAGSCISQAGQHESERRFMLAGFIATGGAFEIEDDGSVIDVWPSREAP